MTYAPATGLGPGYDVFLLGGQSNMTGTGTPADVTNFEFTDPRIKQWPSTGTYANTIITGQDPLTHMDSGDSTMIGHAMAFAHWYVRTIATNRMVLLVAAGKAGSGFTTSSIAVPPSGYTYVAGANMGCWDPNATDGGFNLFTNAVVLANAAMAASPPGGANRFMGILWHQGEADSGLSQSAYAAKLDSLIDGFRSGITGASSATPFILGQMLPEGITGTFASVRAPINAAHIDTPRRKTRTGFYYGKTGVGLVDGVHYSAPGQRYLGNTSAPEAWLIAQVNITGAAPVAPTGVTLTQSGTSVMATWIRPVGRVTDYAVEYNVNAGGWVALTRAQSIDKSAAVTGLSPGSSIQVRVSTVNEAGTSSPSTPSSSLTLSAAFLSDTLTGTNGTLLTAHTGETGATWTKHPTYSSGVLTIQTNRVYASVDDPIYYCSGSPIGANYEVSATIYVASTAVTQQAGVVGRLSTSADTFYRYAYERASDGSFRLFLASRVVGSSSVINFFALPTPAVGESHNITLRMVGSQISGYFDGQLVMGPYIDTAVTAAGRPGIRVSSVSTTTTGLHVSDISAIDIT